jgi:hypothetical protein
MRQLIIALFLFSGFALLSQDTETITGQVAQAIRQGNADELSAIFGQTVDITLANSEGNYSKSQASLIMKDFFTQHPPSFFEVKHQGSSDNGSVYIIGTYRSGTDSFRVYLLLKNISSNLVIQQIQFEPE